MNPIHEFQIKAGYWYLQHENTIETFMAILLIIILYCIIFKIIIRANER